MTRRLIVSNGISSVTSVILMFTSYDLANAQENEARDASQIPKPASTLYKSADVVSKLYDVLSLRDAKISSHVTQETRSKGVNAMDDLASEASSMAAVAAGGSLHGVTNAIVAGSLMSIAKKEGQMLNELTEAQSSFEKAINEGDYAAASRFGERIDASRAKAANFEPDYGSFTDNVGRIAKVVAVKADNAALAFLETSARYLHQSFNSVSGDVDEKNHNEGNNQPEAAMLTGTTAKWRFEAEGWDAHCDVDLPDKEWHEALLPFLDFWAQDTVCQKPIIEASTPERLSFSIICTDNSFGSEAKIIGSYDVAKINETEFSGVSRTRTVTPSFDSGTTKGEEFKILKCDL